MSNIDDNPLSLSEHLCDMIADYPRVEDWAQAPNADEFDRFIATVTERLIEGRHSFSGEDLSALRMMLDQHSPNFVRFQFDEHYTRQLLGLIPKLVSRTLKLPELAGSRQPTTRVKAYLREALSAMCLASAKLLSPFRAQRLNIHCEREWLIGAGNRITS